MIRKGNIPSILGAGLATILLAAAFACSPPEERATGNAKVFEDAKETFGQSRFTKAQDYATNLAKASPANEFSERGQLLSIVISNGLAGAYKELGDAYRDGGEDMESAADRSEYANRRLNYFQDAKSHTLHLAEMSSRFLQTQKEGEVKELTLEAPIPAAEGPAVNQQLERVRHGMRLQAGEHEDAHLNAVRSGMNRSLAEVLGVEPSEVPTALETGSAKVTNVALCLFLTRQLLENAEALGPKGVNEPKMRLAVLDRAGMALDRAQELLEAGPEPDQELQKSAQTLKSDLEKAKKKKT